MPKGWQWVTGLLMVSCLSGFDWPGVAARRSAGLSDLSASARAARMRELGLGPAVEVAPALLRGLADAEAGVRAQAARALGQLRIVAALDPLLQSLHDPDARVRLESATALGRLRAPDALRPLSRAVDDADAQVRVASLWALSEVSAPDAALPEVWRRLEDTDAGVRIAAAQLLGQRAHASAAEPLQRLLTDPVPDVRIAALGALASLPDATRHAHAFERATSDEVDAVVTAALSALGSAGGPRAIEVLSAHLRDVRDRVARAAFVALARIDDIATLDPLLEASGQARLSDLAPQSLEAALRGNASRREALAQRLAARFVAAPPTLPVSHLVSSSRSLGLAVTSRALRAALLREIDRGRAQTAKVLAALKGVTDVDTCAALFERAPVTLPLVAAIDGCVVPGHGLWAEPLADWLTAAESRALRLGLVALLGRTESPAAVDSLLASTRDSDPEVQAVAWLGVAAAGAQGHAREALEAMTGSPTAIARKAAGAAYGRLAHADDVFALVPAGARGSLLPPATWVALVAALELGKRPSPRAALALEATLARTLLRERHLDSAARALEVARLWGSAQARSVLFQVDSRHGLALRTATARALGMLVGEDVRTRLRALAEQAPARVAAEALLSLQSRIRREDVPWLLELRSRPWPVGPNASYLLARLAMASTPEEWPAELDAALCEEALSGEPHRSANGLSALAHAGRLDCATGMLERARAQRDCRGRASRLAMGKSPVPEGAETSRAQAIWMAVQLVDGSVAIVASGPGSFGAEPSLPAAIWRAESASLAENLRSVSD